MPAILVFILCKENNQMEESKVKKNMKDRKKKIVKENRKERK